MSDFDSVDYFSDQSLVPNPYPYFDYLRSKCPVSRESPYGVMAVTGHKEACTVYKEAAFSACVSVAGPFAGVSFESDSDDIGELIEQHRDKIPMSEHIVTQDPPDHTRTRGLLSRLLTPKRLKENEDFMWRLADQQLDTFVDRGSCEFLEDYARPFSTLVIADLLGVPEKDHEEFREAMTNETVGALDDDSPTHNPLVWLDDTFSSYVIDRRREPRDDVLTALALAKYPDGSTPEVIDVVHLATFVFSAGQETTTKLLSAGMRVLAERPDIQSQLREDRSRIPAFLEETLRMESPVKSHFRLARQSTTVGDVPIAAGTTMMLLPGACNRDPAKFDEPHEFRIDRPNVREHVAFGRGSHSCPGAPLARAEGRISLNRILDRMSDIKISEASHGSTGGYSYDYEPTFILRGLTELHLEYTPTPDQSP
ncbi:cytochrome P450 [Mycobacterium sp.]|uniref:cytochrome P450 n=1 Tax=Mycobacterium sp. TaxID=1785 RepID=UPI003C7302F4